MNKHTVFVAGKRFVLLSDDKENYVQKLASEVSAAITKIAESNPSLDRRSSAILCALDYADDKYKALGKNRSISDKAQPIIAQADKQGKQLKEMRDRMAQRDRMIEDYKRQLDELKKVDREQKDKLKKLTDTLDIREQELKTIKAQLEQLKTEQKPDELHLPQNKKYDKAEKKNNKIDITEEDELEEAQLFSLFD